MTEELTKLLTEFGDSWSLPVSSASFNAFGRIVKNERTGEEEKNHKVFYVPALVAEAVANGLLEVSDGEGPIVASDKVYFRELRLTNKGRESIGIPPWPVDKPKVTVAAKKSKQATKSLFE